MHRFSVRTSRSAELLDITGEVERAVATWTCTTILVYVPHTTAGILINEHADPDVARDVLLALERLVPPSAEFRHAEGNSPAHVKSIMVGTSQLVPIDRGRLGLGTWQGIFLAEFDGPRTRSVIVSPVGSAAS